MKVAILAGGAGTRLTAETETKPKTMVEIGGQPLLWHIMMHYSWFGHDEFVLALGYRGEIIKKYLADYCVLSSNLTVDLETGRVQTHDGPRPQWTVNLIDTGTGTATGGRIKRLAPFLGEGTFMLTWGDCLANVSIDRLLEFHKAHGKLATLTAVRPPARYGHMEMTGGRVAAFTEKPQAEEGWINGAFFVLEPQVLDYIEGDETQWEGEPLKRLAEDGQLMAYRHADFWQCVDTLREKHRMEQYWQSGKAPWKVWE